MNRLANPLLETPARPMPRHVAVIGAGAIGPDIAYYLNSALPGLKLTLIDLRQEAIAAALIELLTNPQRRAAIAEQAEAVLSRYDWDLAAADTLQVLEEAALGR